MATTRKTAAAKTQPSPTKGAELALGAGPDPEGYASPTPAPEPEPVAPARTVEEGLARLRVPFPPESIGKLPRGTCKACKEVGPWRACDRHAMVRGCEECHGTHSTAVIHLDYVGHADATLRLLEVDPHWSWEPFSQAQIMALPPAYREAGLWINLTVLGVTRPGFGDAGSKRGGDAVKEAIGDALRNAAMRFGVALELWAKGDRERFHAADETPEPALPPAEAQAPTGGRGDGTTGSVHHARVERIMDMTRAELEQVGPGQHGHDAKLWDTHMRAWWSTFNGLTPAQQQAVQQGWPDGVPTPSSNAMTIRQIDASRAAMRDLATAGSQQEQPDPQ